MVFLKCQSRENSPTSVSGADRTAGSEDTDKHFGGQSQSGLDRCFCRMYVQLQSSFWWKFSHLWSCKIYFEDPGAELRKPCHGKKKTWFCLEARALVYTWLWWLGLGSLFPGGCCHSDPRENLLSKSKWYTFVFRTVINIFSYIKTRSRVVAWTLDTDPSLCPLQWVLWP